MEITLNWRECVNMLFANLSTIMIMTNILLLLQQLLLLMIMIMIIIMII